MSLRSLQPIQRDGFVIRPATAGDLDAVVSLDARVTGLAKPEYWGDLFAHHGSRRESRMALVAERGGTLLGFIVGEIRAWEFGSQPCGWIFALSVDPEHREGGIATALFETMTAAFRDSGVHKARTMLKRDNHALMSFFRSQGMMAGPFVELEKDLSE